MRKKLNLIIFIAVLMISIVNATEYNQPGTYEVRKGDTITFNDMTLIIGEIEIYQRPIVYIAGNGIASRMGIGQSSLVARAKYSDEKPMKVVVKSIDVANGKAVVTFIDNIAISQNNCNYTWEGYVYDPELGRCNMVTEKACNDPFEYKTPRDCTLAMRSGTDLTNSPDPGMNIWQRFIGWLSKIF